jgi:predicted MPP superfamily phosphohydrolase
MALSIRDPELFGVTESSVTLTFRVEDGGAPVDAAARVRLDGVERSVCEGPAGTRHVRIDGLAPATRYAISIEVAGGEPAPRSPYFPEGFETHPAPRAAEVASFATLNDLHFGEPRFGGVLTEDGEWGGEHPDWPAVLETDGEIPYWRFMNEDAVSEINAAGVDFTVVKGDIADRGRPEQFAAARECFAKLDRPHHAFLGNHDHYARLEGREVDGYALLGQPPAPRAVDVAGWRLLLLDTVRPGHHHGEFDEERLAWLAGALEETRALGAPTLLFMHHHPVPHEFRDSYPNSIGIVPEHSVPLFELVGRHAQVRGVLIGHTHRNRVRRHRASGATPWVEVNCTKDYPGGWGHYRLFEDGSFRQEVRRTSSGRALEHSTRCAGFFQGGYRRFALGTLAQQSFVVEGPG